jgi:hypothetical protein
MQRNILLGAFGVLLSSIATVGGFHLCFRLFYQSHHAEDASSLLLLTVLVGSVILSTIKGSRSFGIGMLAGSALGDVVVGAALWGA